MGRGLVAGIIFLIVLLGGYIVYTIFFADPCKNLPIAQADNCYIDISVEKGKPSICEEITESNLEKRDICFKEVATQINDATLCEKIIGENRVSECYSEIAAETDNLSLCEKTKNPEFCKETVISYNS